MSYHIETRLTAYEIVKRGNVARRSNGLILAGMALGLICGIALTFIWRG